jgi:uncharacterized membrane protein
MVLGTAALYIAAQTGHATSRQRMVSPQVNAVLLQHRTLATETKTMFTFVSAIFGLSLLLTLRFRLSGTELDPVLPICFLVFYAIGIAMLASTARLGGQLVREFGL